MQEEDRNIPLFFFYLYHIQCIGAKYIFKSLGAHIYRYPSLYCKLLWLKCKCINLHYTTYVDVSHIEQKMGGKVQHSKM